MNYSVKHLRFNGTFWTCELSRWEGCVCTSKTIKVEIHQVKRPSLLEIKNCAIW